MTEYHVAIDHLASPDPDTPQQHAKEIPGPGPDHGMPRLKGVCINNSCYCICCVVKSIYKFKCTRSNKTND